MSVIARRNFGQVLESVAMFLGERYGTYTDDGLDAITGDKLARIKQLVNDAQAETQDIVVGRTGSIQKVSERFVVHIAAPKTSGATVAITQGAATVTFSAEVAAASDANRHIKLNDIWFRIKTYTDTTHVDIECNFGGTTLTAAALAIYSLYHALATGGANMVRMIDKDYGVIWPDVGTLDIVDMDKIFITDPELKHAGTPSMAALANYQGETRLVLWPVPNVQSNVILRGVRFPTVLTGDADNSDLPEEFHLLWEHVAIWLVAKEYATAEEIMVANTSVEESVQALGLKKKTHVDQYISYEEEDADALDPMWPGIEVETS